MGATAKHPPELKGPKAPMPSPRPSLRVVPGGPETEPAPSPAWLESHAFSPAVFLLLVAVIGVASGSIAFFAWQQSIGPRGAMNRFSTLARDYRLFGIERYLQNKQMLKEEVSRLLRDQPRSSEGRQAQEIAVYLFPELLADENFEKAEALSIWAPLERAIERSPRSQESEQWLNELRAALWNYENPSREHPRLSPCAAQTLRIYETLASH